MYVPSLSADANVSGVHTSQERRVCGGFLKLIAAESFETDCNEQTEGAKLPAKGYRRGKATRPFESELETGFKLLGSGSRRRSSPPCVFR